MSDLYSEMILEYYKYPKNKKKLDNADIKYKLNNPLCGDECEIYVKLDEEKKVAEEITFDGRGCAISIASASILTQLTKGKSLLELKEFDKDELLDFIGIKLSPNRLKCALLGLETLKAGIKEYLGGNVHFHQE